MINSKFHLAQMNVSKALYALDDPRMAGFVAELDVLNAVADDSPGFVWRLKSETGGASSYVQAFDDPRMLVNLTVWTSLDLLEAYTYGSAHRNVLRDRRQWFEPPTGPTFALWWTPAGELPTVADGMARLAHLSADGPSPFAFTFKKRFPAPLAGVQG